MAFRILVCGDREWTDRRTIQHHLGVVVDAVPDGVEVVLVHGDCRGADRIAGEVGEELGIEVEAHPANWKRHGRAAGPIRNTEMLNTGPDVVLAFHTNIEQSRGTWNMMTQARDRGVEVIHVDSLSKPRKEK